MREKRKTDVVGESDILGDSDDHTKKKFKCKAPPLKQEVEDDDESEWEETKCPICWDHPHNAVLLRCSSHKKGCRPYMCNTSSHHSNCLKHFYRRFSDQIPNTGGGKATCTIKCPMCRGRIIGWKVVGPARSFMNSKPRSCSCEGCDFRGNYSELRLHVRSDHPSARPAEPDPRRVSEWARRVSERDYEDAEIYESSDFEDAADTLEFLSMDMALADVPSSARNLQMTFSNTVH